jgi:hypothetical protein
LKVSQNALKLQFGGGGEPDTVTPADADAEPPLPEHVRMYVEFDVGETVSEPLMV